MAKLWDLSELRAQFRVYTGRPTTGQISDSDINDLINDYYVNQFPSDAKVDEFDTFFTQALSATDDGVYDISQDVDRLDDPVTINGNQIRFYRDRESFFSDHQGFRGHHHHFLSLLSIHNTHTRKFEDEQFITEPTLVIGSSDSTKVKHSDFSYNINDFAYSKSSSEVDLTGSAVPSGKYGAWSLKIDSDGTITVAAAENSTGYLTPRLALEALDSSDSASAYMGYVTVIKSDGAFTPATTALDAANVTATFTDGRFEGRTTPISALLYGQKLYVYPKPNDIYQLKALHIADRPTALSGDSDAPADRKWGNAIALGAAIIYLQSNDGNDIVKELTPLGVYLLNSIQSDKTKRLLGGVVQRSF